MTNGLAPTVAARRLVRLLVMSLGGLGAVVPAHAANTVVPAHAASAVVDDRGRVRAWVGGHDYPEAGGLWLSAHVGWHDYDGPQFGFDVGLGYEMSVARPLSLGVFARLTTMMAGNNSGADAILVMGLTGSIAIRVYGGPTGREPVPTNAGALPGRVEVTAE